METTPGFDDIKELLRQLAESQKETDRITRENAKLIGGLGDKFGSFTEGMAFPAMEKTLRKQFGMETVSTRVRTRKGDRTQEIDVLGYANGPVNTVVIVEVISHLRERDVEQVRKLVDNFAYFHPERRGKRVFCIVAYVDAAKEAKADLLSMGVMLARINDDAFELDNPDGFVPRDFADAPVPAG